MFNKGVVRFGPEQPLLENQYWKKKNPHPYIKTNKQDNYQFSDLGLTLLT